MIRYSHVCEICEVYFILIVGFCAMTDWLGSGVGQGWGTFGGWGDFLADLADQSE